MVNVRNVGEDTPASSAPARRISMSDLQKTNEVLYNFFRANGVAEGGSVTEADTKSASALLGLVLSEIPAEQRKSEDIEEQLKMKAQAHQRDVDEVTAMKNASQDMMNHFIEKMINREYDLNGNLVKITKHNLKDNMISGFEEYEYDKTNKLTKIKYLDANGKVTSYDTKEYDVNGNIVKNTHFSKDSVESTFYNNKGQVIKFEQCDLDGNILSGNMFEYDENGNKAKSINYSKSGIIDYQTFEYNELGNMIKSTEYFKGITHDSEGNIQEGDFIKHYEVEYDGNGQVLKETEWKRNGSIRRGI